jgi:acyl-CoA thioesterase YciA
MQPEFSMDELVLRTIAMPKDTNFNGDIFGGWLVSQMDLGGCIAARKITQNRVVTVAIDSLTFIKPVSVGDTICCYAKLVHEGRTSMSYKIAAFVRRQGCGDRDKVTEAKFTYVALDDNYKPTAFRAVR